MRMCNRELTDAHPGPQAMKRHFNPHFFPERGQLTPMPPTDPTLYRLYEIIGVYGYALKSVIHESEYRVLDGGGEKHRLTFAVVAPAEFGDGMCVHARQVR